MKKTVLFSLLSLFVLHTTKAQILVSHSFENANLLSGPTGSWAMISFSPLSWETNNDVSYVRSGARSAYVATTPTQGGAAHLLSHTFSIETGKTYRISFWYRVKTATDAPNLRVDVHPGQFLGSSLGEIWSKIGATNTTYQEATIDYVATETRNIVIGFNGGGSANTGSIYIDDVQVTVLTPTGINETQNEKKGILKNIYLNPSGNELQVQFQPGYSGITDMRLYDVNGICHFAQQVTVTGSPNSKIMTTGHLPAGTYFLKAISKGRQTGVIQFIKN